jgi:hypothetical protein
MPGQHIEQKRKNPVPVLAPGTSGSLWEASGFYFTEASTSICSYRA